MTDSGPTEMSVQLEKFRFNCMEVLSRWFVESSVEIESRDFADHVCVELSAAVFGERLGRHRVVYPCDWWQHLKQRWFPAWATRRWPVLMEVAELETVALYPEYRSKIPGEEVALVLLELPGLASGRSPQKMEP